MALKFYVIGRERRSHRGSDAARIRERRTHENGDSHYIGIRDKRVSRRHAEIYVVEDRIFMRDLGSKNGTFIMDGGRVERLTEGYVRPQQIVSFGGCLQRVGGLLRELDHEDQQDQQAEPSEKQSRDKTGT